jgi:acetyl esterase
MRRREMSPPKIPAALERPLLLGLLRLPKPVLRRMARQHTSPDGLPLDPQIALVLELMRITKEPELTQGTVDDARRQLDRTGPILDFRVPDVATEDRYIPSVAGSRRARFYKPPARGRGALVWFHGGGFVIGSIDSHDGVCRKLAERAGILVVSVDYRLAPEHPFPAATEDAAAVTRWVIENAASLGVDPHRVAVGGDSAGGNLSALTAITLRDDPIPLAFQLLVYPAVDLTRAEASHRMFREGFILTEESMSWFIERYVESKADYTNPKASPIFEPDLKGLAPALVFTAGFDPLRDEGRAYAARLRDAGNRVEHVEEPGMVHGYYNLGAGIDAARRSVELSADRLRAALS